MTTEHDTAHPTHRATGGRRHDVVGRPDGQVRDRTVREGRRMARVTRAAGDALHVRRAFGEPVRQGDVTLIPVAKLLGGSGSGYGIGEMGGQVSGGGKGAESSGSGGGGAFGIRVKPMGVYVVEGSTVRWQPALDLNRIILGGQIVGAFALLVLDRAVRRRRGRR